MKIYLFFGVYGAEDIIRLRAALCFFVFFRDGSKENLHRLKKILKQTGKQRVFVFVPCVDRSCGDTGFFGDLVQRGFLKALSKKFRISSLNDPIIQGMIPIGHVLTSLNYDNGIIDNDVIITSVSLFVNEKSEMKQQQISSIFGFFFHKNQPNRGLSSSVRLFSVK